MYQASLKVPIGSSPPAGMVLDSGPLAWAQKFGILIPGMNPLEYERPKNHVH